MARGKPLLPKHSNSHHVYPKSRVPRKYRSKLLGKWMVIPVPIKTHNCFHAIFGNRTPEEQAEFLRKMCDHQGILDVNIYLVCKTYFDAVFSGILSFKGMREILKRWDLSEGQKIRYAEKLTNLKKILNDEISGGISFRRFKLN